MEPSRGRLHRVRCDSGGGKILPDVPTLNQVKVSAAGTLQQWWLSPDHELLGNCWTLLDRSVLLPIITDIALTDPACTSTFRWLRTTIRPSESTQVYSPMPNEADLQNSVPKTWRSRFISNAETAALPDAAGTVPETVVCGRRRLVVS
jgi:hypothetical protein